MCKHINEHWNNEHLKRLVYNTSLYIIFRLGIILTTCLRAGTVWPILRRKWKTLSGSRVNTTGFQMPRKAQHRVQTHWDHFRTRDHFSLRGSNLRASYMVYIVYAVCFESISQTTVCQVYFLEYNTLGRSLMYSPKIDIPPSPHLKYMVEESSVVRKRNWRKSRGPRRKFETRASSRQEPGKPLQILPYKSVFLYGRFCDLIFRGSLM